MFLRNRQPHERGNVPDKLQPHLLEEDKSNSWQYSGIITLEEIQSIFVKSEIMRIVK